MKNRNKVNANVIETPIVNPVVNPVIETPATVATVPPVVTEIPVVMEISELAKIKAENAALQAKLVEVSKKKSPGFIKTGKAGYDIVYDFLVQSMSETGQMPEKIDYDMLTNLVRSAIKSNTYNNAKMESRYFGLMLGYIQSRFTLALKS